MTIEYRSAPVRETDEGRRQLLVIPVVYGVVDDFHTSWAPGVFAQALEKRSAENRRPVFTWRHEMRGALGEPIGQLSEHSDFATHLSGVVQLDDFDAVPLARRAFVQYRSGTLRDVSVEFDRQSDEPDPKHRGATRITRADLPRIAAVMEGSVPGARVFGTRGAEPEDPDDGNGDDGDEEKPAEDMVSRATVVDLAHRLAGGSMTLEQALQQLGIEPGQQPTPEEITALPAALEGDVEAALAIMESHRSARRR